MCRKCKIFILDYLCIPSTNTKEDPFYNCVNDTKLQKAAPHIADAIYECLVRITPLQSYVITKHFHRIKKDIQGAEYSEEIIDGIAFYTASSKTLKGEIDVLVALIEDFGILKKDMRVEAWLGVKLIFLWTHLMSIHVEHEKKASCSYSGPPLGMKVPIQDRRTEEQKEHDALYY